MYVYVYVYVYTHGQFLSNTRLWLLHTSDARTQLAHQRTQLRGEVFKVRHGLHGLADQYSSVHADECYNFGLEITDSDAYGAAEGVDVVAPRGHEVREYSVGVSERGGIGAVGSGDAECSDHVFWQSANDGWKPEKFA